MFNFKDPSEYESAVPPVPDIKAWINEFRSKHPSLCYIFYNIYVIIHAPIIKNMKFHNNEIYK